MSHIISYKKESLFLFLSNSILSGIKDLKTIEFDLIYDHKISIERNLFYIFSETFTLLNN